jgi:hypothetical protein
MKIQKCILFISCLLFAFTTSDSKSEYILPPQAYSLYCYDLELNGDNDIVVGHNYSQLINWTGISILFNDGYGYFTMDTFYFNGQHRTVLVDKLNYNDEPDLITQYYEGTTSKIGILLDFVEDQSNLISFDLTSYADYITSGDVNGNGFSDIIIASNNGQFWGVLYNDGIGNFSQPEYHNVDYYPTDLQCGDLDNDGREDIVLASEHVEIYYSTDTGFVYNPIGFGEDQNALADFDLDGDIDIVGNSIVGAGYTSINFYENIGNQQFIIRGIPYFQPALGSLNIADIDNDSLTDIIMENGKDLYIFYNEGDFLLSEPSVFVIEPISITHHSDFADFDGNGYVDIVFTRNLNDYLPNLKILFNDGNGNFQEDPITNIENQNKKTLAQIYCFPNPFTASTQICFEIRNKSMVQINIFDNSGKPIHAFDQGIMDKGSHCFEFSAEGLPPGIYFCSLEVNGIKTDTKKMTLMK